MMAAVCDATRKVLHALEVCGCQPRPVGDGKFRSKCPVHRDVRPSLMVTDKGDLVLIRCFAGCHVADLLERLGLTPRDLFSNSGTYTPERQRRGRIVVVYPYEDEDGQVLAQKVRFEPKGFAWRRPNA